MNIVASYYLSIFISWAILINQNYCSMQAFQ